MATSMKANAFHVRSTSLPSTSHPFVLRFEEEIQTLRASLSKKVQQPIFHLLCDQLNALGGLYQCVEDILGLPCSQQAITQQRCQKWVAAEVQGLVRLLDMSSFIRDAICCLVKDQVQGLQSALRTARVLGGDSCANLQPMISAFASSLRKARREMRSFQRSLKQMEEEGCLICQQFPVIRCLQEMRITSIHVFASIFSSLSNQLFKSRSGPWSFLSREQTSSISADLQQTLVSLRALLLKKDGSSLEQTVPDEVDRRLKALEHGVCQLDLGLEPFFRHLISTRVSLLNIANL